MAKYDAEQLRELKAKGQTMPDGSYPIADDDDLGNAIKAVGMGNADHDSIRKHIMDRAKALGKASMIPDTWQSDGSLGSGSSSRSVLSPYTRSFVLEDISIRAGGDGRTVEAYAAVFDQPAAVHDQDGTYEESLDPRCFDRAIGLVARSGKQLPVMFNHGQTIFGTPSELDSMPIGVTEEIRADKRGLFTRARYLSSDRADNALEAIRSGAITAYSFAGSFSRSDPQIPRGGFRRTSGALPTVRRMESTLREYGPTPFPVYSGAEVVGVRAEMAALMLNNLAPGEFEKLATLFRSGTPSDPPDSLDASDVLDVVADDPPERHSTRTPKQELQANRARFLIRHGGDKNA